MFRSSPSPVGKPDGMARTIEITALNPCKRTSVCSSCQKLLQRGESLSIWLPSVQLNHRRVVIVDKDGRKLAAYGLRPLPTPENTWEDAVASATAALEDSGGFKFQAADKNHDRGQFKVLNRGIAFGGGTTVLGNRSQHAENYAPLETLTSHPAIQRVAGFQSCRSTFNQPCTVLNV